MRIAEIVHSTEFLICGQFFLYDVWFRSYVASNIPNFRFFCLFVLYKMPKKVPVCTRPTAVQGLHCSMLLVIPCCSEKAKGWIFASGIFLQSLVGELGTSKVVQIIAYGKCMCNYTERPMRAQDASSRTMMCIVGLNNVALNFCNQPLPQILKFWVHE